MKRFVPRSAVLSAIFLTVFGIATVVAQKTPASQDKKLRASANELVVTTTSEKARTLYRSAITDFENLRVDSALDGWRAAVKLDPAFAMAHSHIAFYTTDAVEGAAARARTRELAARVDMKMTAGEKLYIQWVLYEAGNWLLLQRAFEPARHLLDRTIALDKNFAPGLNDLGRISEPTMDQALVVVPARGRKPSAP